MPIRCYPKLPEAEALLSLLGIRDDLEQVDSYCKALLDQAASGTRDLLVWEGLASAALIAYGRCFGKGVRQPLGVQALDGAPAELREAHTFCMELRNMHVAHSVNAYEENKLVAVVSGLPVAPVACGVEVRSVRVQALSEADLERIRGLVVWLLGYVRPRVEDETSRVLALLQASPVDELLQVSTEHLPSFLTLPDPHSRRRGRY